MEGKKKSSSNGKQQQKAGGGGGGPFRPTRQLYDLLGVAHDASIEEIAKAYRRLALQHHPDRNPEGGDTFRRLAAAYEVLSNPEQRRVYDMTGDARAAGSTAAAVSADQRFAELGEEMALFWASYVNSEEERADLAASFARAKGKFSMIVRELALFDNTVAGEVQRIRQVIDALLAGSSSANEHHIEMWRRTATDLAVTKMEAALRKEAREADQAVAALKKGEVERNTGGSSDADCVPPASSAAAAATSSRKGHRKEKDEELDVPASLRAAIGGGVLSVNRQRAMSQWDDMTDALMAKYGGASKKKKETVAEPSAVVGKKRNRSKRDDDDTSAA